MDWCEGVVWHGCEKALIEKMTYPSNSLYAVPPSEL